MVHTWAVSHLSHMTNRHLLVRLTVPKVTEFISGAPCMREKLPTIMNIDGLTISERNTSHTSIANVKHAGTATVPAENVSWGGAIVCDFELDTDSTGARIPNKTGGAGFVDDKSVKYDSESREYWPSHSIHIASPLFPPILLETCCDASDDNNWILLAILLRYLFYL